MTVALGLGLSTVVGVAEAGATNTVGPGDGVDAGGHNSGAYSITTTDGQLLGFCITPGLASPTEIPTDVFSPVAAAPNGELAYLGYFAATFQGGFDGYDQDDVDAAVAYIAYGTGLGEANVTLVAIIEGDMATFPGPWTITVTPLSGGTFTTGTNYTGDVTVTAANGNGVPGLAIVPPTVGGAGEWTNFVWDPNVPTDVTDAAGHLPFVFNQSTAGPFLEGFSIVGGAPGTAPLDYAPPAGSGGQSMLAALASPSPSVLVSGTMAPPVFATAAVEVLKSNTDGAYVPVPAGVTFNVLDSTGSVVDQLTTAAGGVAGPSPANLPVGNYTVVETWVPATSGLELDPTPVPFAVTAADMGGTTPVTVTVPFTDSVVPGTITIKKTDSDTKVGLAGAQFTVAFDATDDGSYSTPVAGPNPGGSFTTGTGGMVIDPSGVLTTLLPGNYRVTETVAPLGHAIPTPAYQDVTIPVGGGTEAVVFADQTVPTISTSADGSARLGTGIADTATLTAASAHATGTITFTAYGPYTGAASATCTAGDLAYTSIPVTVAGSGTYPMAGTFTSTAPGLYEWVATYSGDANNLPVATSCGAAGEQSSVVEITTASTALAQEGSGTSDTATVTLGATGTTGLGSTGTAGSVTFTAYGPYSAAQATVATCTAGTLAYTSTPVTAAGSGTYPMTGSFTPTATGIYEWVATYTATGGAVSVATACGDSGEATTVVAIATTATPAAVVGSPISDTATLAAPAGQAGSITFAAYGPYTVAEAPTATCATSELAYTSPSVATTGPGSYPMGASFSPPTTGLYLWVESYTPTGGTATTSGTCGAAGESTAVVQVATTATAQVTGATPIADTVAVTGPLPGGSSVTSTLYRSSDTSCTTPLWTTPAVTTGAPGDGTTSPASISYVLDGITEPAGLYQWVETVTLATGAVVATGACNAAHESSVVLASIPAAVQSPISAVPAKVTG